MKNVTVNTARQEEIKKQMAANSAAWHSADTATKRQLEQANEKLASQLGGSVTKNAATGTWSGTAKTTDVPTGFTGSAQSVSTYTPTQNAIVAQMNANSVAWHDADTATRRSLEAQNKALAAQLGGNVTKDDQAGVWSGSAAQSTAIAPTFSFNTAQPTFQSSYSDRIDAMLNELLTRENFTFEDAPTYTDNYSGKITDMMGQIENRDPFSYDAAADPLYQQYQTQYNREGNRAMNDTLAAAAANAGGMNSYAMTAAQQANDYWNAQLTDKIPELQQLAYEMYLQDFDQDVDQLNLYRSLGETEYNRWRDSMSDWRADRSEAYGKYLDNIDMQVRDLGLLQDMDQTQYNRYRDTMDDWRDDRNFAYGQYRDEVGDYQWQTDFDYGVIRDAIGDSQWHQSFDHTVDQDKISNDLAYGQLTGTVPSTGQSTLANQEFGYSKDRDKVEDSRYNSETAWDKAMTLLSAGAMPDAAMLAAAGMTQAQAQAILAANAVGGSDDGDNDNDNDNDNGSPAPKPYSESLQAAVDTSNAAKNERDSIESQLSAGAKSKLKSLSTMTGQMSSEEAIANTIALYANEGEITMKEAEYMFRYFGYDPSEWIDYD